MKMTGETIEPPEYEGIGGLIFRHGGFRVWAVGDMNFIILIVLATVVCALCDGFMEMLLHVPDSLWYLLPFVFSLAFLGVGLVIGLRRARPSRFWTIVAVVSSIILVFSVDTFIIASLGD